jgi:hypothetical protein
LRPCQSSGLLDGDLEAEVFETADEALGELGMIAAVEVGGVYRPALCAAVRPTVVA